MANHLQLTVFFMLLGSSHFRFAGSLIEITGELNQPGPVQITSAGFSRTLRNFVVHNDRARKRDQARARLR